MFIKLNSRRGQNTAEYAILIGVIVAAAIAMQIYIRRGMQARIKDAVDFARTGDDDSGGYLYGNEVQYEPYYMESGKSITTTQSGETTDAMQVGGGLNKTVVSESVARSGNQTIGNYVAIY